MSETIRTMELAAEEYFGLLSGVANHEAKALTVAAMAHNAPEDGLFSAATLDSVMHSIQGQNPGWKIGRTVPFTYCDESLGPIGAVTKSTIKNERGRSVAAYGLTDYGKEYGLAMAGLVLDWSLRYPELSVQTVLGSSQSKTENRTPVYRLAVLESILTAENEGISFSDIVADHPDLVGLPSVVENLKRGAFAKVVTVTTNQRDYNPTLSINDPSYGGRKRFEQLSKETQSIYETMQHFSENAIHNVKLNDFIETTIELYPELSAKNIRTILCQKTDRKQTRLPGVTVEENSREGLGGKKSSNVRVNDEYKMALYELLTSLNEFQHNRNIEFYQQRAIEIVNQPDNCAEMMAKAARNSAKVRAAQSAQPTGQIIMDIVGAADTPLSVYDISEKLEGERNLPISVDAIRNHLVKAIGQGILTKSVQTEEHFGRSKTLIRYSMKDEGSSPRR